MPPRAVDPSSTAGPGAGEVTVTVDGCAITGRAGQTLAGILLANARVSWRRTSRGGRPRGVFCGIGVCYDCIATVNGLRDVRLCQRRAADGDQVATQHDQLPLPCPARLDESRPAANTIASLPSPEGSDA